MICTEYGLVQIEFDTLRSMMVNLDWMFQTTRDTL